MGNVGLSVELQSGQVVAVTVRYDLEAKDLVVLTPTRSIDCQELPLSDDTARLGQLVLLLGFPDIGGADDSLSATPGYVVNVDVAFKPDFFFKSDLFCKAVFSINVLCLVCMGAAIDYQPVHRRLQSLLPRSQGHAAETREHHPG